MTRELVLADTHIGPRSSRRLPDVVSEELGRADVVLHAGDVLVPDLLDELGGFATVHAVLGNNDDGVLAGRLPETRVVDLGGVAVGLIHDSGPTKGREGRLRRRFPDAAVVVFGHSHQPVDTLGNDGQRLFNPGSPTERRRAPSRTYGILEARAGRLIRHQIIDLT
ncbi:metallophosphoesterase [soil metagenome]